MSILRARWRIATLGTVGVLACALPSGTAEARAFMSCGSPGLILDGTQVTPSNLKWLSRPRSCTYSEDGTVASQLVLRGLKWRHWGKRRATASGYRVDNHDQDGDGAQRHRGRVVLSRRGPAIGDQGPDRRRYQYYGLLTWTDKDPSQPWHDPPWRTQLVIPSVDG
jgi:hypothetical protein